LPHEMSVPYTRDERARQAFVAGLREHILTRVAAGLRRHYDDEVAPALVAEKGRAAASGPEVHRAMKREKPFRFYSAARRSAQEMVFASVIPGVDRQLDTLSERAAAGRATARGSLTLDPDLTVPANVTDIDVHLAPGSYHAEYGDDDVGAGAVYDQAINVFAFRQFGRGLDDIGHTMANFVRLKFPDLDVTRVLDCGCTIGHNTLPWAGVFADADIHAIDVAPGVLRYAHARAENLGAAVHFRQMNATNLSYPDNSFDVVFSSMFLHELPLADIRAYFREAHRVLKPGGLLWNMELPPNSAMGPYESFYLDWDSYYNNEPFYKPFRDQDYRGLIASGGFAREAFVEATLPRYTFVGDDAFRAALSQPAKFDSQTGRMDPDGTRWYGFGARKAGRNGGI
ncbi:MAG: class I SAM-dependent methyltransferase, partial [Pseudomonadota bacterium]